MYYGTWERWVESHWMVSGWGKATLTTLYTLLVESGWKSPPDQAFYGKVAIASLLAAGVESEFITMAEKTRLEVDVVECRLRS